MKHPPWAFALLVFLTLLVVAPLIYVSYRDGALVGRIYSTREQKFISTYEFVRRVSSEKVVLLGEIHDNEEHHKLQHYILREMVARGARPAVVMEQFDREFQSMITEEERLLGATTEGVLLAGRFQKSWGDAYKPIVAFALKHKLPIIAANISRDEMCAIIRDPSKAVLPEVDAKVSETLAKSIKQHHGKGDVDPEIIARVTRSQRARDFMMAQSLDKHADRQAVLIAGVGHARRDLGVPLYLRNKSLVVAFTEVDPDTKDPRKYLKEEFADGTYADYVWFTKRAPHTIPAFRGFCPK